MSLDGVTVLVVEDVRDIRHVLDVLLTSEGADVVVTGNGRDALELLRERLFDVVLTDLGLPDIPGDILVREIVALSHGHTRVIALTGHGERYVTRARLAGAEAVFTKPVQWNEVITCLAGSRVALAA